MDFHALAVKQRGILLQYVKCEPKACRRVLIVDEPTASRVRGELEQITTILEEITGRSSQWNGELYLIYNAEFLGKKPFDCRIELEATLADMEVRWRTLIHEALHALSAGYTRRDFDLFYGWEEGVVEQLQRLLRPEILARLGVSVPDLIFEEAELEHPYNGYVAALESIRAATDEENAKAFYIAMLETPIRERHASLLQTGLRTGGDKGRHILSVVSAARVTMESRF